MARTCALPFGGIPLGGLRYSATGRWLAWVNGQTTIQILDVHRGDLLTPFTGHDDAITGLAFRADERALASSSDESTILLWDVAQAAVRQPPAKGGDIEQAWRALAGPAMSRYHLPREAFVHFHHHTDCPVVPRCLIAPTTTVPGSPLELPCPQAQGGTAAPGRQSDRARLVMVHNRRRRT